MLDVGKSNVKLLVVGKDGVIHDEAKLENESQPGPPYQHLNTQRIWRWLRDAMPPLARRYVIDAIVPTTHGATAAWVDKNDLVMPVLDYEQAIPQSVVESFDEICPDFSETFTPKLPVGMNLGSQIFWLQRDFKKELVRTEHILAYPQYLSWMLTGVAASEPTSIGCHTHLWNVSQRRFSTLVEAMDWQRLFPPMRHAYDRLGPVQPALAAEYGLESSCQVHAGIHDSNGNYALYLRHHPRPFSLVSTGTWMVLFSPRLPLDRLDKDRDTMAMVNVVGEPLPTARFMGGREYDMLIDGVDRDTPVSEDDIMWVIHNDSFVLPSFTPGGPYLHCKGGFAGPQPGEPGQVVARALLYIAIMTATSAKMLEMDGDLIIDGGFANNPWFCRLLAGLSDCERCYVNHDSQGTALGAASLAVWDQRDVTWSLQLNAVEPFRPEPLDKHVRQWRNMTDRKN